jgi:hypothetical protein
MKWWIRPALLAGAVGAFFAWNWYDKQFNYVPVSAKITDATMLCYLSKKGYKEETTTDERPCPMMRALAQTHPKYQDFTVKENVHLTYTYDVGGKSFQGTATRAANSRVKTLSAGNTVEVLVSKADPAHSRWK